VYIGHLDKETSKEEVAVHIKDEFNVNCTSCVNIENSISANGSFKVCIDQNDFNKLLDRSRWPEGTIVNKFIMPKSMVDIEFANKSLDVQTNRKTDF
jgi:hypothetical protein